MSDNGSVKSESVHDVGEEKPKERKSIEETVTALRKELQVLYESLADKNEQLLCYEKDVRDRDISIKYLKNEYKKLKESVAPTCPTCHKKVLKANDQNGKVEESKAQPDEILNKMQKDLKDREGLIKELNKKIMRLSDNLIFVQKESLAKDDRIDDMQREIDKFRQVVNFGSNCVSDEI